MKNITLLICSLLLFSYSSLSQIELEEFESYGSVINIAVDDLGHHHLTELVHGATLIDDVWVEKSVVYSKYDQDFNLLYAIPLVEYTSESSLYFINGSFSNLRIDNQQNVNIVLLMRQSITFNNGEIANLTNDSSAYYVARIATNDGSILKSELVSLTAGTPVPSRVSFDPNGELIFAFTANLGDVFLIENGVQYVVETSPKLIFIELDDDLEIKSFYTEEIINTYLDRVQDLLKTADAIYALSNRELKKYDFDYNAQWTKSFATTEVSSGMALNPNKSITIGSSFLGSFSIDSFEVQSISNWDNVVFNISENGDTDWIEVIPGLDDDDDLDVACDQYGINYYFGDFRGTQMFGDSLHAPNSTNVGRILGRFLNGEAEQSIYISPDDGIPITNNSYLTTSSEYLYLYQTPYKNIYRFCIEEANTGCEGFFLTDTEEIVIDQSAKIYPNPTTGELNIISEYPLQNIMIFDAVGQLVLSPKSSEKISLDLLAPGIYFFNYNLNGQFYMKKIIKL